MTSLVTVFSRNALVLSVIALVIATSIGRAQTVSLPVHDLLRNPAGGARPAYEDWIGHRSTGAGSGLTDITGEASLLRLATTGPWFERNELEDVLTILAPESFVEIDSNLEAVFKPGTGEAASKHLEWIRACLPRPVQLSVRWTRTSDGVTTTVLSGVDSVRPGWAAHFADVRTSSVVRGLAVEAQDTHCVYNPILVASEVGAAVVLRVQRDPVRPRVFIEAVARRANWAIPPGSAEPSVAGIDRDARDIDQFGAAFCVESGGTVAQEWTDRQGGRNRLQVEAKFVITQAAEPDAPVLRVGTVSQRRMHSFRDRVWANRSATETPERYLVDPMHAGEAADFAEPSHAADPAYDTDDLRFTTQKLLLAGKQVPAQIARADHRLTQRLVVTDLRVQIVDVPTGTALEAEAILQKPQPDAARLPQGGKVLLDADVTVLADHWATLASRLQRVYVVDWEQEASPDWRVFAPRAQTFCAGFTLDVKPGPDHTGGVTSLRLMGEVSKFGTPKRVTGRVDAEVSAEILAGLAPSDPVRIQAAEGLPTEQPVMNLAPLDVEIQLDPDGYGVSRRTAVRLLGPGRELVVLVHCRRSQR